ncbi:MAG: NAD(+) synthase [Crocinitomicaceae bacterium]|nr:NAD(+) synthase [Crocinitomicaceae bacterium]
MQALKIADHISSWLKEYCENAKMKGFVVGISGGIDSAVTSTLCAQTGLQVICLNMPIHQNENQENRGVEHIEWLISKYPNVSRIDMELTPVFDNFIEELPKHEITESQEMALVNTRARMRMTALYYFAQLRGMLVAGTGNKVEDFGIGFFTKYGDGGVDLSPIADLYKTEVFEIGKALGVSQTILDAPPTDGLWNDDRTDEDQIGATYAELEWAMEYNGDVSQISERQKEVIAIYERLNRINQHKMQPIPVCLIPENLK